MKKQSAKNNRAPSGAGNLPEIPPLDMAVSIYRCANSKKPLAPMTIGEALEECRKMQVTDAIARLRTLKEAKGSAAAIHKLKQNSLKAFCALGMFTDEGHQKQYFLPESYTGDIPVDIDKPKNREEAIKQLAESPHCLAVGRSPGGIGIKALFLAPPIFEQHEDNVEAVAAEVKRLTGYDMERPEVNRLTFFFPDPQLWINRNGVTPIKVIPKPKKTAEPELPPITDAALAEGIKIAEPVIKNIGPIEEDEKGTRFAKCSCPYHHEDDPLSGRLYFNRNKVLVLHCTRGDGGKCKAQVEMVNRWLRAECEKKTSSIYTVRSAREIVSLKLDEHDNLFGDRLLTKGGKLVIAGQGDIGKSRLLLHLLAALILQKPFLDIETHTKRPRILLFQTENNNRRLQFELRKLTEAHGEDFLDNLRIHVVETDDDGLIQLDVNREKIENTIAEYKPDIVGFDPLRDLGIGNLDSDVDMSRTCSVLGQIARKGNPERAIIIVHHARTGKGGISLKYDKASFARNSKALFGWTRAQLNIMPGIPTYDKLVIDCGKNNDGKHFEMFAVTMNPNTMMYECDPQFDFEAWQEDMASKASSIKQTFTLKDLEDMDEVTLPYNKMVESIIDHAGCRRTKAKDLLEIGQKKGVFRYNRTSKDYTKLPVKF
jgi:hypothetical protein